MNRAAPAGPVPAPRDRAHRGRLRLPPLVCAIIALQGCARVPWPVFEPVPDPAPGPAVYIAEVSRAYRAVHDRWPREFYELVAFCIEEDMMTYSDIEDGIGRPAVDIDIFMFKDARFAPLPDGNLEATYSFERARGGAGAHLQTASVIVNDLNVDEPCGKVAAGP